MGIRDRRLSADEVHEAILLVLMAVVSGGGVYCGRHRVMYRTGSWHLP